MRTMIHAVAAVAVGVVIAFIDSGPSWDDTGVTAGAILIATCVFAFAAGRRPWLWAVLVGAWVPAVGILLRGDPATMLAFAFALVGAYAGHGLRRAVSDDRAAASPR
jgi:uncharacterized membrane protein AbrB (regulator of aidB expression)